jgi:transposase
MLVGRHYRLNLDAEQTAYCELVASICRAVWNLCLDQRQADDQLATGLGRTSRWRVKYVSQARELAELKRSEPWLSAAPSHCLQQTLRDLDTACRAHGPWGVHFRARSRWKPSFRFPDAQQIGDVQRLGRHVGEVRLPKLGAVRFRWSRPLGGSVRNVTVQRHGRHWYITFCVEDYLAQPASNGLPPVGIDRGVVVPVATSDGQCFDGAGLRPGEQRRLRHLQRRLAHQKQGSNRRRRTVQAIGRVYERAGHRRADFCQQTAHTLTTEHGLVVVEDLRVKNMTASPRELSIRLAGRSARRRG